MTAGPSTGPTASVPRPHLPRGTVVLLAATLVVIAVALVLPWWSETEVFGPSTWTQAFSPLTGVTAGCSPTCGPLDFGPPSGPLQGTSSFSSVGLDDTGILYLTSLGLVLAGAALIGIAIAMSVPGSKEFSSPRGLRTGTALLSVALLAVAVGAALLPALQPSALRADTTSKLSEGNAWTAAPSPETSFLGGCQPGPFHGTCASGGSANWGPGPGWVLLVVAAALLIVVLLRNGPGPERPAADPNHD